MRTMTATPPEGLERLHFYFKFLVGWIPCPEMLRGYSWITWGSFWRFLGNHAVPGIDPGISECKTCDQLLTKEKNGKKENYLSQYLAPVITSYYLFLIERSNIKSLSRMHYLVKDNNRQ